VWSVGLFIGSLLAIFLVSGIVCRRGRSEVREFLNGANQVAINGKLISDPRSTLEALRSLGELPAHHSHDTKIIRVIVRGKTGQIILNLGRDSDNPREYWVFYPRYRTTTSNDIGHIITSAFDGD
jgi:hypothetical protein